jgi:hypothetical protein
MLHPFILTEFHKTIGVAMVSEGHTEDVTCTIHTTAIHILLVTLPTVTL